MLGGAGPVRVDQAGPDTSQLGPGLLPGQVSLAQEDLGVGTEVVETVGGGEDSQGGEEGAATHKLDLLSPGHQRSQGCSPGLAGCDRPLSTDNTNYISRPRTDDGAQRLCWLLLCVKCEDPTPLTWLWRWSGCGGRSCCMIVLTTNPNLL